MLVGRPALAPLITAARRFGVMLVVAHPDAEVACERVEPLDQRGLRLAGFGALVELGHQGGEGVLGRRPGCWHVLLHRTSHSAHSFHMLEAYRAAGIPWPTVSSLPYTTAPEATGRGS